jgi:hypothetical protein
LPVALRSHRNRRVNFFPELLLSLSTFTALLGEIVAAKFVLRFKAIFY